MSTTLEVVFDGEVFRPATPPNLKPNTRYVIIVQDAPPVGQTRDAWSVLDALTGSVDAPPDWAREHDHYLYGTPKTAEQDPEQK